MDEREVKGKLCSSVLTMAASSLEVAVKKQNTQCLKGMSKVACKYYFYMYSHIEVDFFCMQDIAQSVAKYKDFRRG